MKGNLRILWLTVLVLGVQILFAADKLEVTKIISPPANSDIVMNEFQDYTLEITNNGTIDFTAEDTAVIYIGFVSGQQLVNLQPVAYFTTSSTLSPTQSTEYTFKLKINFNNPGLYGVGFGLYWEKNPNPTQMLFQISAYNFITSTSMEDSYISLNRAWYNGQGIRLSLSSQGEKDVHMALYSLSGQKLIEKKTEVFDSGNTEFLLDTGLLPRGIYILNIYYNEGVLTDKILVR